MRHLPCLSADAPCTFWQESHRLILVVISCAAGGHGGPGALAAEHGEHRWPGDRAAVCRAGRDGAAGVAAVGGRAALPGGPGARSGRHSRRAAGGRRRGGRDPPQLARSHHARHICARPRFPGQRPQVHNLRRLRQVFLPPIWQFLGSF